MMKKPPNIMFHNAHLYGPDRDWYPGWIATSGSLIWLMGAGNPPEFPIGTFEMMIDAKGKSLLPGFIDLHVHGAMGQDAMDASLEGLQKMAGFYASHGVTSFLATTWAAKTEAIMKVLETYRGMIGPVEGGSTLLGVHLEGPYLNSTRSGAQDPDMIQIAKQGEAEKFLDSGIIKIIDIAPEFPENLWLIDECVRRGITVSVGHSAANYDQVKAAAVRGLKHATHTFNAMTQFGHRELGTVGAVMTIPEISCELISDNIHVHPGAQKILIEVKGPEGVILVTDSTGGTGLPDGDLTINNRTFHIQEGATRLLDGTLAGSSLTMERALKNAIAASGIPLARAWRMSSLNAARDIGVSSTKGSLEVGKDADLVLVDDDFEVILTLVEGRVLYSLALL